MSLLFDCRLLLCRWFVVSSWLFGPAVSSGRSEARPCRSCLCPLPQLSCHSPTHPHTQCVSQKGFLVGTPLLSTYFHHCSPNPPVHPHSPTLASNEASNQYLGSSPALTAPIDRRSALRARRATACDCRGVTWSRRGRPAGK